MNLGPFWCVVNNEKRLLIRGSPTAKDALNTFVMLGKVTYSCNCQVLEITEEQFDDGCTHRCSLRESGNILGKPTW